MHRLLHETLFETASRAPDSEALVHGRAGSLSYAAFAAEVERVAGGLAALGVRRWDRVAVYLPKLTETAVALYAAAGSGAAFVPVNPLLKAPQVAHILADCTPRVLVTQPQRLDLLADVLAEGPRPEAVVLVGDGTHESLPGVEVVRWETLAPAGDAVATTPLIDHDMAAILYTSGSTGRPKGVVLSHRNVVVGAQTVSQYLEIDHRDRLLAVLPFSFDYGLNQLTSAVLRGATCILLDYLLPRDVPRAVARHRATGLAGVPPLWTQLAAVQWPEEAVRSLRYITNSGGAMPEAVLRALRERLPHTRPYLMYGLTEAFRSTYLPPEELDRRPGSMGRAIPGAEVLVVRPDGSPCAPGEPGELVHRGALVALGYWNDPERTAERFRPVPGGPPGVVREEIAVWSGDTVVMDEDGYLYFVGRSDAMIKTSGYRVSPEEVEEAAYATGLVAEAVAVGVPHPELGQAIVLIVTARGGGNPADTLKEALRMQLPNYMVPGEVLVREALPRTPNGKLDRNALRAEYAGLFAPQPAAAR